MKSGYSSETLKFRETAKTMPYAKFETKTMLYLHVIIVGSMHGNDHQRSEYWYFWGRERREGEGWGSLNLMTWVLKDGSKYGRLKI